MFLQRRELLSSLQPLAANNCKYPCVASISAYTQDLIQQFNIQMSKSQLAGRMPKNPSYSIDRQVEFVKINDFNLQDAEMNDRANNKEPIKRYSLDSRKDSLELLLKRQRKNGQENVWPPNRLDKPFDCHKKEGQNIVGIRLDYKYYNGLSSNAQNIKVVKGNKQLVPYFIKIKLQKLKPDQRKASKVVRNQKQKLRKLLGPSKKLSKNHFLLDKLIGQQKANPELQYIAKDQYYSSAFDKQSPTATNLYSYKHANSILSSTMLTKRDSSKACQLSKYLNRLALVLKNYKETCLKLESEKEKYKNKWKKLLKAAPKSVKLGGQFHASLNKKKQQSHKKQNAQQTLKRVLPK